MSRAVFFYPRTDYMERGGLSVHPPLSVLYPATVLKTRGYPVTVVDQRVEPDWQGTLANHLQTAPLFLGISAMTGRQIHWGLAAAGLARQRAPGVPIVWGGVHPSLVPRQTVASPFVDFVLAGEAEQALVGLVEHLARGSRGALPRGVVTADTDACSLADPPNLDELPLPSYELLRPSAYGGRKVLGGTSFPILTSRGCSHNCAFCYNGAYHGRRWRAESPERTMEHLRHVARTIEPATVDIQDDNFFASPTRAEALCRLILGEGLKTTFKATCRVEYVLSWDDAFLRLLAKAGFTQLFLGAESGSDRVLASLNKGHTVRDVVRCNERLVPYGIAPRYSFMAGFPGESESETGETVSLMLDLLESNPSASCTFLQRYAPYPGTELASICGRHGWLPPSSLEEWACHNWYGFKTPWLTPRQSERLGRLSVTTMLLGQQSARDVGLSRAASALVGAYSRLARARLTARRPVSRLEALALRKALGL